MNKLRLQTVLTAFFVLVAFIPLGAFIGVAYKYTNGLLEERVVNQTSKQTEAIVSNLGLFLAPVREDVLGIAGLTGMKYVVGGSAPVGQELSVKEWKQYLGDELINLTKVRKVYDHISLFDEKGNELMRIDHEGSGVEAVPESELGNRADESYFIAAKDLKEGQIYTSPLELDTENGKIETPYHPVVRYATPILDYDGTHKGVLVVAVLMKEALAGVGTYAVADGGAAYLIDAKGDYIVNTKEPEKEWGFMTGKRESFVGDFPGIAGVILSKRDGALETGGNIISFNSISPLPVYNNVPDPTNYWIAVKMIPQRVAFAPLRSLGTAFFLISSLVLLGIFIVGYLFSRSVTRPIKDLSQAAERVATGKLDHRVDFSSKMMTSELYNLGNAFNKMMGELKKITSLEEELKRTQELERTKSEFISIAAHQLRTPLSTIKWTLRMLADGDFGKVNEEQKHVIEEGSVVSDRMIELVADLLNVSRLEGGKFNMEFTKVDLVKVFQDLEAETRGHAREHSTHVVFNVDSHLPESYADQSKLLLAIGNLVTNAIKYTPDGGDVTVEASYKDGKIYVTVKDTGIGIPKEHQDKIFTKFFRTPNAKLRATEGTGLGLYIAKNIIEKHNGSIRFESEENKGTTFFIEFPVLDHMTEDMRKPLA